MNNEGRLLKAFLVVLHDAYLMRKGVRVRIYATRRIGRKGFNMEDSHLGEKRFVNLLTLLIIAYAAAFIEGLIKIRTLPIPLIKKREVQRISIFRYGFVELLHDFWANVKNLAALPT